MNIFALTIGIIIAILLIWHFKRRRLEMAQLPYPILLASFPFYYFTFALYVSDFTALYKELAIGTIFFALAFIAIKSTRKTSATLVGLGCISHALYDHYHNIFFINSGTPSWWLEFCGSIDFILGVYLLYFALTTPNKALNTDSAKNAAPVS